MAVRSAPCTVCCALCVCVVRVRVRVQGCRGKPGAQLGVQRDRRSRETCSDLPSRCVPRPRRTCGRENLKCRLHLKEDYLTFLLSSKPLSIIPLDSDLNNKFFIWLSLMKNYFPENMYNTFPSRTMTVKGHLN